ncbi:hypothetical protein K239x_05670 [Planctomycetes bacterium K23_9]|uniref:Uncharacterized protein n=1 Tax=Stieleria marina TaxID=1930275 RepID=A0A517NNC0_9BACT|nr:hypothetical protein K239x_05670 [Planctomycetes bacterium K23_9]
MSGGAASVWLVRVSSDRWDATILEASKVSSTAKDGQIAGFDTFATIRHQKIEAKPFLNSREAGV